VDVGETVTYTIIRRDGAPYQTELRIYLIPYPYPPGANFVLAASGIWNERKDEIEVKSIMPVVPEGWYIVRVIVHGGRDGVFILGDSSAFKVKPVP
jgi:hypothetical protein